MKLAYEEFHLWYSFGLSLACAGKVSVKLEVFEVIVVFNFHNIISTGFDYDNLLSIFVS